MGQYHYYYYLFLQYTKITIQKKIYTDDYVKANPAKFLSTSWVNSNDLRHFLASSNMLSHPPSSHHVKCEPDMSDHVSLPIKRERFASPSLFQPMKKSEALRVSFEDGKEVIEIFSSDEDCSPPEKIIKKKHTLFSTRTIPTRPTDLSNGMLLLIRKPFSLRNSTMEGWTCINHNHSRARRT